MSIQYTLDRKKIKVISLPKTTLISEVAETLSAENIGTVMLTGQGGRLAGIISERDIIKEFAKRQKNLELLTAEELMTPQVITCSPEASLSDVLALMSANNIRHLPVVHEDELVGLISVRDVLDTQQQLLLADIERRKQDIVCLQEQHDALERTFVERTEQFEASESHYRSLFENSQLGIRIARPGAEVLFANDACARLFGFKNAQEYMACHSKAGQFIAPYDRERLTANLNARLEGKPALNEYEYDALKFDGSIVPVQVFVQEIIWDGEPAIHRVFIDISKRRAAEELLRTSEARFRAFFDNSPSVMYAKDRDHKLSFVNAKYLEFHKVRESDVIGKRGGSTLSEQKRAEVEALDNKVMSEGNISTGNVPMTSKSGDTRDFLVIKFPIYGATGDITGIGGINTDVTELRERENQLIAAKLEAEKLAKKADAANLSKSQFLATMSHEIRTPMNGVLGMADILAKTNLTTEQQEFVQMIKESGHSLLDILNDILDLSKIEAGHMELESIDFSIAELLHGLNALWGHTAQEKGLEFTIENNVTHFDVVRSDHTRLRQVLNNLVGNAIKFTKDGTIALFIESSEKADGKTELRIQVRDTGIGVSEEQKKKLFQPFTQADSSTTRQFGGTGLGLSICKKLVELMGGKIGLDSTPGQGSTFWFTVPVERSDRKLNKPTVSTNTSLVSSDVSHSQSLRILIAEDNAINQKVIAWLLAPLNSRFDIVENGLEAIAAVARSHYDLILMDIQMPEMDGITATKKIRSLAGRSGQIAIIALTANAMQGDREKCLEAGMTDYVAKPLDQRKLINAISRVANIPMVDVDLPPTSTPLASDIDTSSLDENTEIEINKITSALDDVVP